MPCHSSASRFGEEPLESTRRQNITVTCPPSPDAGASNWVSNVAAVGFWSRAVGDGVACGGIAGASVSSSAAIARNSLRR